MQESIANADARATLAVEFVDTYSQQAATSAVYPTDAADWYLALGIADEAGEVMGKLVDGGKPSEILAECGDVLWYASQLARHHGLNLKELVRDALLSYESGDHSVVAACAVIAAQAGSVAGVTKKVLRGDRITPSDVRRRIGVSIGLVFLAVHTIAEKYGSSLQTVMQQNLDKLEDRKARGVIRGDGDTR